MFSFKLPFQPAASTDPVPMGLFAAKSVGSEPGLVVIDPKQGHVVYWDNIANASSFLPGQGSTGIQGFVPGMLGGETITAVTSAEPAGYILTFSHGRVAHLSVKDPLGRPNITVQFLRKRGGVHGGGIFDSIRGLVGRDRRQPVAAIRPGKANKGRRDILIITETGSLEQWSTDLAGGDSLSFETSVREGVLGALRLDTPDLDTHDPRLTILDLAIVEGVVQGDEVVSNHNAAPYSILLLTGMVLQDGTRLHLVEGQISEAGFHLHVVHPITSYRAPSELRQKWHPRLCVPKPGEVAFVIFETAVVVFSLAKLEATPSSQLLMEGQRFPEPFEDCIRFQREADYRILGVGPEDAKRQIDGPSCAMAIQGFGIIRIVSTPPSPASEEPQLLRLTLKSKMEQAVFFGTIGHNPLDLAGAGQQQHSIEEIEEAAMSISQEILNSTSKYIPAASPSIDHHLKLRAKALHDLSLHIQQCYTPLPRNLKWKLLSEAEKLAAARAMWKVQEEIMKRKPKDREETYWEQVLFFMPPKYRTPPEEDKGERDMVRLWLTKDVDRTLDMIRWLFNAHHFVQEDNWLSEDQILENKRESSELWTAGTGAVYKFREDNAPFYGLEDEVFSRHQGVLQVGWKDLPQLWMLNVDLVIDGRSLLETIIQTVKERWQGCLSQGPDSAERRAVLHMAHILPKQFDLFRRLFFERCSWRLENEAKLQGYDRKTRMNQAADSCRQYFYEIAALELVQEAIQLAERWEDMEALVELNAEAEIQAVRQSKDGSQASTTTERKKLEQAIKTNRQRTDSYFEMYGEDWANAHFNQMVLQGQLGSLLVEGQTNDKKRPYLTQFLRKGSGFRKISWINDVLCEKDFGHAAKNLDSVAMTQHDDAWARKTSACMAKLAHLSTVSEAPRQSNQELAKETKRFDDQVALLHLQERLRHHVLLSIGPVIDDVGALQVAMEVLGHRVVGRGNCQALKRLLRDGLVLLIQNKAMSAEQLVDIFTLIDPHDYDIEEADGPAVFGHEFWLALESIRLGNVKLAHSEALFRLVWRRAMIRDDWTLLNETADKGDDEVTWAIKQSSLFCTLQRYYEKVDQKPEEAGAIKLFSPAQIADADIFPKSLRKRYRENELESVQHDLQTENDLLKTYIEKGRLDSHYGGLLKMAQTEVSSERGGANGDKVNGTILE